MQWVRRALVQLWAGLGNIVMIVGWIGASTILAYAAKAAGIMSSYAPFSWVAIGMAGASLLATSYALLGWGRNAAILARWRKSTVLPGDTINPMADIFVDKRIYINNFVNPYNQVVLNKKFIRCEIIGPANIVPLIKGGKFIGNNFDFSDAAEISPGVIPQNAIAFSNCDFEDCRFFKVTLLFISSARAEADRMIANLNWLTVGENPIADAGEKPVEPTPFERDFKIMTETGGERPDKTA